MSSPAARPRAKSTDHNTSPSSEALAALKARIYTAVTSSPTSTSPSTSSLNGAEIVSTTSQSFSASTVSTTSPAMANLIPRVVEYVKEYMAQYDGSHDFNHIKRVLGLAHVLRQQEPNAYDKDIVTLAALLHDVGDRKYLKPGQVGETMVRDVLLQMGSEQQLAERIQEIVNCVSYSSEIKPDGLQKINFCIKKYGREIEVVQDADRIDAIGAVGVGRCFAFGGSKVRGLQDSIDHFTDKLERLGGMMKTQLGRQMAKERTETIVVMRRAWERENEEAMKGLEWMNLDWS